MLAFIIGSTGHKGVDTSLIESKYKYQMVGWLQHMARSLHSFKLGNTANLGLQKTDYLVSHYITARRQHFGVLVTQYWGFIIFKTLITAALLILGCILVVQQQINMGQFVASEIIIILIMGSVEKLILKLDVVYDVLTSLEKVATVTELPLEENQGLQLDDEISEGGLTLQVKHLDFQAGEDAPWVLTGLNFRLDAGKIIGFAGLDAASQKAMVRVLLGMFPNYRGSITYNGLSLRDLDPASFRRQIGWLAESDEIIPGTILDNILYGQPAGSQSELMQILEIVGLSSVIQNLPKGLHTWLTGTPWTFSSNLYAKITLARCLLQKPRLLFIEDSRLTIEPAEKNKIYERLIQARPCTLVFISNTEAVLQRCEQILLFSDGRLAAEGTYADLQPNLHLQEIVKVSF
ncbi:ATP-binding cassette domain-containing protein [Adhaeribacter pallidiroseus]|uniref:ABC transporter B family member n=1 Tax=Adhaeribacter pallidiroseus TaxID=2072847 RepID=A0A369QLT2_9BACT|nr:ATP-binding cassette domain-containing protein [Adhaeribacter pallidiroseus]RDC64605.1 ABC transporter B family member [Adhaeribacter pallidiroseus]